VLVKFLILILLLCSRSLFAQPQQEMDSINQISIGYRKETVLKTRMKKLHQHEIVIKGYYEEVIGLTSYGNTPEPIYGKKRRFRRVESTVRDREFRRKFGI